MNTPATIPAAAMLLDLLLGDPVYRLHPVRLIGALVSSLERALRNRGLAGLAGGSILLGLVVAAALGGYIALRLTALAILPWCMTVLDVYVFYSCIALRDMGKHAEPVATALRGSDLPAAREHLQRIVGRDTALLDEAGVVRATVETVAEGFVDGFLAPLFWCTAAGLLAGVVGLPIAPFAVGAALVYRCVNTLDSMVGYRNEQYLLFGRAAARTDDVLNFVPARLSLGILWLGAMVLRLDAQAGMRVALRDRLKHASPNSAHSESFVAGTLGLRLGGPTTYPHGTVDKPWIGEEGGVAVVDDICRVCGLTLVSGAIATLLGVLALGLVQ